MQDDQNNQPKRRPKASSVDGFLAPRAKSKPSSKDALDSSPTLAPAFSPKKEPEEKASLNKPLQAKKEQPSLLNASMPNPRYTGVNELGQKQKPRLLRFLSNRKRWSWKKRASVSFAVLVVALVGLGAWDAWQLYHKVNHINVGNLTQSVGGAENILVAGSTNRCNLKVQNAEWGFCSDGVTGVNSDIIFIIHVVPKTHSLSLLSIPRDTFVPNARSGNQAFKIDAALYQGPTQLVKAVEQDFGIPIQHYAEVGFDGFVNIVNAVGGIKMDFPEPVYDSESYLDVKTPGCKLLNGIEALQVVRARHLQYDPPSLHTSDVNLWPQETESDIARIARTHEFLRVIASTVAQKGLSDPITDQKLVDAIAPQVQVDSGFSASAMIQLIETFHSVNINNVPQYTLPISTVSFGSYEYMGESMGDVVFPVEANDQQIIDEFLGTSSNIDTMTGNTLPKANLVRVNVVNGSGVSEQASQVSSSLKSLGFKMVGQPGTATPVSDEAQETVVNYDSSRTEADAEAVARQLTGYVVLSQNAGNVTSGSEVTVVTGTDLGVNVPSSSPASSSGVSSSGMSSSGTSSSSTSTAKVVSSGSEDFSAPTSANQPLSAWDPRACTANQPVETNG